MKRGRPKKQATDKSANKKTGKTEQISEVTDQVDLPPAKDKDLKKIQIPEGGIIEEDQCTLSKKDLFRIDEVAQYFDVTERTVRLWIDHGHLSAVKKAGSIRILRKSILDCHILERRENIM